MSEYDWKEMCRISIIGGLALVVMMVVLLSSCTTPKNVELQKQIDYSDDLLHIQSSIETLQADFSKQVKMTSDKLSHLQLENKTVYLSAPDSTGKQYTTKVSETSANKQEQERVVMDETILFTIQVFAQRLDSLSNQVGVLIREKEKRVEVSWWNLHGDAVLSVIVVLVLIGCFWYKLKR